MANRNQRKAKRHRAAHHSKGHRHAGLQPTIREAQQERADEQAARLRFIGGRFGELLAKATVLPPPAPRPGEPSQEYASPVTDEEREELLRLAPSAKEGAKQEGIRLMTELRQVARRLDARTAIAIVSWVNLWGPPGEYFEPANTGSEVRVELLTGVVASQAAEATSEASTHDYQRALDLTDDVLAQVDLYLLADSAAIASQDSSRAQLRYKTLARRLHMRGESYLEHGEALAREVYGPHEAVLRAVVGFGVEELIGFVHAATLVVQDEANRVMEQESNKLADAVERGMKASSGSEREALAEEARDCLESMHVKLGKAMTFTVDQLLAEYPSLNPAGVQAVLSAFTTTIGDCGPDAYTWPLDEHPLLRRPVLALEDGYMIPVPGLMGRDYVALLDGVLADVGPGAMPSDYLASAAERISLALMRLVFSDSEVHGPLFYRIGDERYETDGLVLCENVAIVIEAKARPISLQATRGDTARLQRDLEDAITEGVRQGVRLADLLLSGEPVSFEDDRGAAILEVPGGRLSEVHILNPQLTTILDLGSQPAILALAGVDLSVAAALPIFLNDLRVIVDCIETPAEFVAYLRWRAAQPLDQLVGFDEGDLLGAFLLNEDFRFLVGRPAQLHGYYTTLFDDYYAIGIGAPRGASKPQKMLPRAAARFVRAQRESRAAGWLDAAIVVVNLGVAGLAFVDVKATEIATRARRTKAAGMLVYGTVALIRMPPDMDWREGLALTRSSMPDEVAQVVFVNEERGRLQIRWAIHL